MLHPETHENSEIIIELHKEYALNKKELESLMDQWEKIRLELEELLYRLL